MKKYFCCIISILLVFSLIGCSSTKVSNNTSKDEFDINKAIDLSKKYVSNIIKGEADKNKELLSEEASGEEEQASLSSDLVITNYDVYEYNELGKSTMIKVYTTRNKKNGTYSSVDTISVKVIKEEEDYKIDKVVNSTEKEAYVDQNGIKFRNKDDIKTKTVLKTKNLPEFAFDKTLAANSVKMPVERGSFSNLSLSISGETLAVATYNKDSFIFLVNVKQTQETASSGTGDKSEQGGQGQGQEGDSGDKEEKYIGNNVKEAGVLKDKKVEVMSFSPDGKYLVAQYTSANENSISLYDVKNTDETYLGLDKTFDFSKVNVTLLNVEKSAVKIKATKKDNASEEDVKDMTGEFLVDVETAEIKSTEEE